MKVIELENGFCKIGESAQENWDIIKESNQNDLWFHIDKLPSCHVVLDSKNKKFNNNDIKKCAELCKENSKYSHKVTIIYTEIKNISIYKSKIGSVVVKKSCKKICV